MLFLGVAPTLDDAADMKDADVAEDDMDELDDCEPKLLRRSSLLLSTKSCSVFLLSAAVLVGGLLLDIERDDTLFTLLAILLKLLLLLVLGNPLLPSCCIRAFMDAENARLVSSVDGRLSSTVERGVKSLDMPTRCTFFSSARGVVLAAIPKRLLVLELGEAADVRPGVGIREILVGVRSFEPEMRFEAEVETTRRDAERVLLPSSDVASSSSSLVASW